MKTIEFFDGAAKVHTGVMAEHALPENETHWRVDTDGRGSFQYFKFDSYNAGTKTVKMMKITKATFRTERGLK